MTDSVPLSVSELTARIKIVLEGGLPPLWVQGEISQFTRHRSGHCYFTLVDDRSQLSCVLWRGRIEELNFLPQAGDRVVAHGKVAVYERGGRYQFDCYELRPAGIGELALAFEALKQKLAAEGLFALERKIPLPPLPEQIGLVTSPEGAALQDILKVAGQRAPWVTFWLAPVHVQGSAAAGEIAAGITALDESGRLDLIILARGGGPAEDLWAFNEAVVVRAIAHCRTPIVSAVGHEVDVTLADLAADLRAPTPSAAAELCLPDKEALQARLKEIRLRMNRVLENRILEQRRWLHEHAAVLMRSAAAGIWREQSQRLDDLSRRLESITERALERLRAGLGQLQARHALLNPWSVLSRGYSVVQRPDSPRPLTNSEELKMDDPIRIIFHKGRAGARVTHRETS